MPKLSLPTIQPTNHFAPGNAGHQPQSDTITPKKHRRRCDPAKIRAGPRGGAYYVRHGRKNYVKTGSKCFQEAIDVQGGVIKRGRRLK